MLVIPESGRLDAVDGVLGCAPITSREWVGDNRNKGLGVIAYGEYSLRIHEAYEPRHRWILPLEVSGPESFLLFAVWTVPHRRTRYYVTCLFDALKTYRTLLRQSRVLWAGDFNQSAVFDDPSDPLHFSHWLAKAGSFGFESLYHRYRHCEHGKEPAKTFFLHHDAKRPFHIDYIFAKPEMYRAGFEFEVGTHRKWSKLSDHVPLTLDTSL